MRTSILGLLFVLTPGLALAQSPMEIVGDRLGTAGQEIEDAIEAGEITKAEGWEEWYATRDAIIREAIESGELSEGDAGTLRREVGKAELKEHLEDEGKRIKEAYENGEMTEQEAWSQWEESRKQMMREAVDNGTLTVDEAKGWGYDADQSDLDRRLEEEGKRIKEAAIAGEMSGEEAWDAWYETKDDLINEALDSGEISVEEAEEYHREMYKAELSERLNNAGREIGRQVASGEMSEDEGWAAWEDQKNDLIGTAVEVGEVSELTAEEFHLGIEKYEVGQKLKSAVAKGEMTEEDARAEWAAYEEEAEAREQDIERRREIEEQLREEMQEEVEQQAELDGNEVVVAPDAKNDPNDDWARYTRDFINRYQLTDAQEQRAWRFYSEAKRRDDSLQQRLIRIAEQDDDRAAATQQRVEQEHERLFQRLKGQLDRLPSREQRKQAGG